MTFPSVQDWNADHPKRILLFGMSGLGKTHVSNALRDGGGWFHYSIDYRIGTRYMGEHIVDNFKREAMRNPFLAELLRSDSIYIASNITFDNLKPLSTYLGKPGDPAKGGIPFAEYKRRQELHRQAEISALLDTPHFVDRAHDLYGYENFVCDSGGSICEVVDPANPDDAVMTALSDALLMIWIEGNDDHIDELVRRFDKAPKPMYFNPAFLDNVWQSFLSETGTTETTVDPDAFMRYAYRRCLDHRLPRYRAMAARWGISVQADDIAKVRAPEDFHQLISAALATRADAS